MCLLYFKPPIVILINHPIDSAIYQSFVDMGFRSLEQLPKHEPRQPSIVSIVDKPKEQYMKLLGHMGYDIFTVDHHVWKDGQFNVD